MIVLKLYSVLLACESFRLNVVLVSKVYQLALEIVVTAAFKAS